MKKLKNPGFPKHYIWYTLEYFQKRLFFRKNEKLVFDYIDGSNDPVEFELFLLMFPFTGWWGPGEVWVI